jgi:hypothetical protein
MGRVGQAVVRHRKALATLGILLVGASLGAWWALQLWGLPDIGDPFDVAAFEAVHVPESRNAFVEYYEASSMFSGVNRKVGKYEQRQPYPSDWSSANSVWRDLVTQGQEALSIWREGTEKPDALYEHGSPLSMRTLLPVTDALRTLGRLAVLEGSRLETEGNMAGAWGWYRAALRSSRHSGRHGFQIERLVGAAIHNDVSQALTRWASNPKVDAPLLRQALDDVIAIDAMTIPRSESIKIEYDLFIHALDDPNLIEDVLVSKMYPDDPADWCQDLPVSDKAKKPIQAARVIMANDRERSLRLLRLMTANWLAQVDKPLSKRSRLIRQDPPIYEADPSSPPSQRALPPEKLSEWLDSSLLASRQFHALNRYAPAIDRERSRQSRLVVHLATELYRREHGQSPASPEALVGPYLKALPEGYDTPEEPAKK